MTVMTMKKHMEGTVSEGLLLAESDECVEDSQHYEPTTIDAKGPLSQKCVSFSSWVDVVEIRPLTEYSKEEINETWLSKKELYRIMKDAKAKISLIERNSRDSDDIAFSARGLESEQHRQERKHDQQEAIHSVLNEQYLQRAEGTDIPELIATLYSVLSFPRQQHAYTLAIRDALDVDQTHHEIPLESEMPFDSDGVLQLLADEEKLSSEESFSSIEEWLVERFEKASLFVDMLRARQYLSHEMDSE